MLYRELTGEIIECAFEVHKTLGQGFLENVYHKALEKEFAKRGLEFNSEVKLDVFYKGDAIGFYYADLIVEEKVVIELKATEKLTFDHKQQLRNYLKASKYEVGLIFNFGERTLNFKRQINTQDNENT